MTYIRHCYCTLYEQVMGIQSTIKIAMAGLGLAVVLGGCQGLQGPHASASLDNRGFMTALEVYRHCQVGTDVDTMRADLTHLLLAAEKQESASSFSLPLPNFLNQMMEKPLPRLAADPNAMAAACALSIGQTALLTERMDLATEMFQSVIKNHSEPEYAYYTDQARIGLDHVEHAARFAGYPDGTPVALTISAVSPAPGSKFPVSSAD